MSIATVSPAPVRLDPRLRGGHDHLNVIGLACFVAVLLTVFVDVNTLTYLVLGSHRIGSPLILLFCLSTYIAFQFRFLTSLGRAGRAFVFGFIVYLLVGSIVRLLDFSDVAVYTTAYYLQTIGSSLVILLACAVAARSLVLSNRTHLMIWLAFAVLMITVSLMFVGKFFGASLYALHDIGKNVAVQIKVGRTIGFFTNPNDAGMAMALTAAVGFACLKRTRRRLFVISGIVMAGVACVSTFSRSAMLTFIVVAIMQVLTSSFLRNKSVIFAAVLAVAGFVWFVADGYKQFGQFDLRPDQERRITSFVDLAQGKVDATNTGHRFVVAGVGLRYWLESPLFGHGIGTGNFLDLGMGVHALGPHNQFVLLLIEGGLPAFLTFVFALALSWFAAIRCKDPQIRTLAIACLTVFSCNCLTSHNVLTSNYYAAALGIVFGGLSAAAALHKRQLQRAVAV